MFIPFDPKDGRKKNEYVEVSLADWNNLWEAGQLRQFFFRHWPRGRLKCCGGLKKRTYICCRTRVPVVLLLLFQLSAR